MYQEIECLRAGIGLNFSRTHVGGIQAFSIDYASVATCRLHYDDRDFYEYNSFSFGGVFRERCLDHCLKF